MDNTQEKSVAYMLSEPTDTSYMGVKRIKLTAKLTSPTTDKNTIMDSLRNIIEMYKDEADIIQMSVQIYIESELANKESMDSELLSAVWVSPQLDEVKQKPLPNSEGDGLYWFSVRDDLFSMQNYQSAIAFSKSDNLIIAGILKSIGEKLGGALKNYRYARKKKSLNNK